MVGCFDRMVNGNGRVLPRWMERNHNKDDDDDDVGHRNLWMAMLEVGISREDGEQIQRVLIASRFGRLHDMKTTCTTK